MLREIGDLIKTNKFITIFTHMSPDGDCLGSAVGLAHMLDALDKDVQILVDENIPRSLCAFPEMDRFIVTLADYDPTRVCDLAIAVDCANLDRFPKRINEFKCAKNTVNIDHHYSNSKYADVNYIEGDAASTSELILKLAKENDFRLSNNIAICLYGGMMTDTGGFRYENTKSETLRAAAELLEYDINVSEISQKLFDYTTINKLALTSRAIESLKLHNEGSIASMVLTTRDFVETKTMQSDSDGMVNIPRGIPGVRVTVLVRELERGNARVNLRSLDVDVSKVAEKFGGGGHIRASGCTFNCGIHKAKRLVIEAIKEQIWTES